VLVTKMVTEVCKSKGHYCLSGEVAGVMRSYLLSQSESRVGCLETNEVILPVLGVSRSHAVIRYDDQALTVEDLDSKNGTFVNGERVRCSQLEAGDRICFGSVELTIEALRADDALLAISVELPGVTDSPTGETTATAAVDDRHGAPEVLERVLIRMTGAAGGDFRGACAALVEELSADTGCLVEWTGTGEPLYLAGSGKVEIGLFDRELRHEVARSLMVTTGAEHWSLRRVGDRRELSCAVFATPGSQPLALLLAADVTAHPAGETVVRTVLRLISFLRGGEARSQERLSVPGDRQLVFPSGYVVGQSPLMVSLYQQMRSLLRGHVTMLLVGETGVGKEYLARALHISSQHCEGPFIAVNCAAIPNDLLEAEMFGIGKGVATGVVERQGKFQMAHGGTLFLDEIGEMPPGLQAKLLRALQENEVRPVGGGKPSVLDLRVITATNMDLLQRIDEGLFRRDLYYRIAGYVLQVPALRDRREDIPALIEHFLRKHAQDCGRRVRGVTVGALEALSRYRWPGNVRELSNEIRRLVYLCPDGQAISSSLVAEHIVASSDELGNQPDGSAELDLKAAITRVEDRLVRQALARSGGNRTAAARLLGITRNGLAIKMNRLGIESSTKRDRP
jgi:DNA-binding NtrC family response regulator